MVRNPMTTNKKRKKKKNNRNINVLDAITHIFPFLNEKKDIDHQTMNKICLIVANKNLEE